MKKYKIIMNQYDVDALWLISSKMLSNNIDFMTFKEIHRIFFYETSDLIYKSKLSGNLVYSGETRNYKHYGDLIKNQILYKEFMNIIYKNHNKKYIIILTQEDINVLYSVSVNIAGNSIKSLRGSADSITYYPYLKNIVTKKYIMYGVITFNTINKTTY